jgi:hypothetical protein
VLRKILTYKEELLTDVKNMRYRHTDDVEKLQKVIADTEQQFADCLQQIKTVGKEKERRQKELEDLGGAAKKLVDMVDPQEDDEAGERPSPKPDHVCQPRSIFCKILLARSSTRSVRAGCGCGVL